MVVDFGWNWQHPLAGLVTLGVTLGVALFLLGPVGGGLIFLGRSLAGGREGGWRTFLFHDLPRLRAFPTDRRGRAARLPVLLILFGSYMAVTLIPIGPGKVLADFEGGLLFLYAASMTLVSGLVLLAAERGEPLHFPFHFASLEAVLLLCLLVPAYQAGSLRFETIVEAQGGGYGIANWFLFHDPCSFAAFFLLLAALTLQPGGEEAEPRDMPNVLTFILAGRLLVVCALASVCFLGGWQVLFLDVRTNPPDWMIHALGSVLWFVVKTLPLTLLVVWLRHRLGREGRRQGIEWGLRFLIPSALLLLWGSALWTTITNGSALPRLLVGDLG
ncbi:MAG: hypothetical protein D6812_05470 [Deltaproteobacteria bacterium]|nr:MAG: hypothetical protein D6812_05470 [Deltaproteobacteria bacterium]